MQKQKNQPTFLKKRIQNLKVTKACLKEKKKTYGGGGGGKKRSSTC